MSLGSIFYFTVGYTSSDSLSVKKNYPIKQKYVQIEQTTSPFFPDSYELVSETKYWFPFDDIDVSQDEYIEYEDGDEFDSGYISGKRKLEIAASTSTRTGHSSFPPGSRRVYANTIFEATGYFFNWGDTGLPYSENPYSSSVLNKWKKIDDLDEDWAEYWFHPYDGRFYALPQNKQISDMSEINDISTTKWDIFTGDTNGIDLTTLTTRKIDELVSIGLPENTAKSTVSSEEKSILSTVYGESQVSGATITQPISSQSIRSFGTDTGYSNQSVNAVVSKSTAGAEGESGSSTLDMPQMVQYYNNPDGTISSVPARFIFDYRPNNVNYSNLGAEWTEIPRVNNAAFVDFRTFKLMRISFEFLVGDNNNIFTSCDDKLRLLRSMSMRPDPVTFLGFDSIFTEQLLYPSFTGGTGVQFAIVDMSFTSVQRARPGSAGAPDSFILSPTGEINRATVSMTIQELPLEAPNLIKLPKLPPDRKPPTPPTPPDTDTCRKTFSSNPRSLIYSEFQKKYCDGRNIRLVQLPNGTFVPAA